MQTGFVGGVHDLGELDTAGILIFPDGIYGIGQHDDGDGHNGDEENFLFH